MRWCGPAPTGTVRVGAQVRAHGEEVPATAEVLVGSPVGAGESGAAAAGAEGPDVGRADAGAEASAVSATTLRVRLDRRIRGVAPGQSVVLYEGTRVVGSATISGTGRA